VVGLDDAFVSFLLASFSLSFSFSLSSAAFFSFSSALRFCRASYSSLTRAISSAETDGEAAGPSSVILVAKPRSSKCIAQV